ncbi:SDR family oxidoreductase [Scatolibacter rhodanostii]|uniref:SDR family oxidoreductase n=1 Tax=Scatolibacter rhodanostii TaxID=2014781 RepID=UPI001FA8B249|nr:SDR family oxidoreductase [Scatolibacter rhodanostii]
MGFYINKTAVITGAGGVLCSAFTKSLSLAGCRVALLDLNETAVKEAAESIRKAGGEAIGIKADVLSRESLSAAHAIVNETFGKCDILINGAGGNNSKATTTKETYETGDIDDDQLLSFFNIDKAGFDFVFSLNMLGTLLPTQVFTADMLGRDDCCIINISSMNAFTPLTKIPAYSAAKAAVSNFTQWLAVHFAEQRIRVNAIAPGFFVTNQNRELLFNKHGEPTARTEKILAATPMKRFGEPEELLGTLMWLTNAKQSGFVTGTVIPVDGGFSAYSGV